MKNLSKLLALLLAFCLVLSVSAFASGDPSGEASDASAEVSGKSAEEAYVDYIHEWLLAELEINSTMTLEQIEDEFMPLIEAGDYVSFPVDMLYNGMLEQGVAMTFEEFAAQYVPEAAGEVDVEQAYKEYLHEWLIAEDEVNDTMTEEIRENEFMPLIWAGDYTTFPAEMLWNGMLENGCPMTYDEFVAAGGVY